MKKALIILSLVFATQAVGNSLPPTPEYDTNTIFSLEK